jgi:hypothetical protein
VGWRRTAEILQTPLPLAGSLSSPQVAIFVQASSSSWADRGLTGTNEGRHSLLPAGLSEPSACAMPLDDDGPKHRAVRQSGFRRDGSRCASVGQGRGAGPDKGSMTADRALIFLDREWEAEKMMVAHPRR